VKKITLLIIATLMILTAAGCGSQSTTRLSPNPQNEALDWPSIHSSPHLNGATLHRVPSDGIDLTAHHFLLNTPQVDPIPTL